MKVPMSLKEFRNEIIEHPVFKDGESKFSYRLYTKCVEEHGKKYWYEPRWFNKKWSTYDREREVVMAPRWYIVHQTSPSFLKADAKDLSLKTQYREYYNQFIINGEQEKTGDTES